MAENNFGIHEYNADQCREILSHLPGIYAAGLRFEEDQLVEIHALASTERNPKQIARDIQSALFAAYGMEVDHRIISIAQLPTDPFEAAAVMSKGDCAAPANGERNIRLQFSGIDSSRRDGTYEVSVHLDCGGQCFTGKGCCRDTMAQRCRTIASATVDAVNELLGHEYFSLLEVKQVNVWDVTIAVTVMEYQEQRGREPRILIGAAVQQSDSYDGIVRSTLDGLNRSISKLYSPTPEN